MSTDNSKLKNDSIYARVLNERAGTPIRQELIKAIQSKKENTKLITYFSKYGHPAALINPDDTKPIDDLLRSIGWTENLELMIHSSGGLSENARKIVKMCRQYCKNFFVVVPDAAKSAATIIALGADKVIMGNTSELGPIDPQLITYLPSPAGWSPQVRPAWAIVRGCEEILKDAIDENGKIKVAYIPVLSNIDPSLVKEAREAMENAKRIAEEFLKTWMLKGNPEKAEKTAKELAYAEKYTLHGYLIDWKEAQNLLGEDNVLYLKPDDEFWRLYWELYLRSAVFLEDPSVVKLFESESNSINIRILG
jgi:ATP-dependent protease ClpP protease subunit